MSWRTLHSVLDPFSGVNGNGTTCTTYCTDITSILSTVSISGSRGRIKGVCNSVSTLHNMYDLLSGANGNGTTSQCNQDQPCGTFYRQNMKSGVAIQRKHRKGVFHQGTGDFPGVVADCHN